MNIHIILDTITAEIGGLYGDRYKFFREGINSNSIEEIINGIKMDFKPPVLSSEYIIPVNYGENTGYARYSLIQWRGGNYPTIIFHHGSGQHNYTGFLKRMFSKSVIENINLIGVSIPFNRNIKEYLYCIGSLERFVFSICSSVRITESLGGWLRSMGDGKIISGGISLGGWVSNLHFAYFETLDEYRPMFSGAALDDLFNNSIYKKLTALRAGDNPGEITRVLNFEKKFSEGNIQKVYPLLAEYDQYVRVEPQRSIYKQENVTVVKAGHITGSLNYKVLMDHLTKGI